MRGFLLGKYSTPCILNYYHKAVCIENKNQFVQLEKIITVRTIVLEEYRIAI